MYMYKMKILLGPKTHMFHLQEIKKQQMFLIYTKFRNIHVFFYFFFFFKQAKNIFSI
mgnify:CR=1 FL=1